MKLLIAILIAMIGLVCAWDDNRGRNLCTAKVPACRQCCGPIKSCLEDCAFSHTTEECRQRCAGMVCFGDSGLIETCTPNFCSGKGEYEVNPIPEPGRV